MASEFFLVASEDDGTGDYDDGELECIGKDSLKENALESPKSVVCIAAKGFADEENLNIDGSFPMLVRIEAESFLNAKGSVVFRDCAVLASIRARAFKGFEGTLKFGNCFTLASIGSKAFSLVKGSLTLSGTFSSLTSIGERAFAEASGNVQLFSGRRGPGGDETLVIGEDAFQGIVGEQTSVQLPMIQDYKGNPFGGMCASSHLKEQWYLFGLFRHPDAYCKVQCIGGEPTIQYFQVNPGVILTNGNECVDYPCSLSGRYSSVYDWKCNPTTTKRPAATQSTCTLSLVV